MTESQVIFGLKSIAKYLDVSVKKVRKLLKKGLPHTQDEGGRYVTTKAKLDEWFEKQVK